MANEVWTEQQKAYLIAERAKGTPVPRIAAALGKPVPATYTRCRMLGSKIQAHTPWTPELETRLRDLATGAVPMTDQALADAVGKSVSQMRWKLGDLDLIGRRTKRPKVLPRQRTAPDDRARVRFEAARARADAAQLRADEAAARREVEARRAEAVRAAALAARAQAAEQRRTAKAAEAARVKTERVAAAAARVAERDRALEAAREARAAAARSVAVPEPIGLAPVGPRSVEPVRTSGRGGWTQVNTGARRQKRGPAPSRNDTVALSRQAQDAVARFMAERGVTRAEPDPVERAISYLRRRGYVVVPQANSQGITTQWTVDHRHVLAGAAALKTFAEARGYA